MLLRIRGRVTALCLVAAFVVVACGQPVIGCTPN